MGGELSLAFARLAGADSALILGRTMDEEVMVWE